MNCNTTHYRANSSSVPGDPTVELAIVEVGMGGRLDATNVLEPRVAVITDIALDHQKFLGETIAEIAQEKAGIIHRGATVVLLPQHPQANDVLGRVVVERAARAVSAVPYMPPVAPASDAVWSSGNGGAASADDAVRNRYRLNVLNEEIAVDSPLFGHHQLRNTALAIAAAVELNATGFAIGARDIERGIAATEWPGRLQLVRGTPDVLLDVAHNPAGAWVLRAALSERFAGRPLTLIFGAMRDKAITEMADILFPLAEQVIATQAANPRSATPEEIADAGARTGAGIVTASSVAQALARAREITPAQGLVVITGSIFVVGEALVALGVSSERQT